VRILIGRVCQRLGDHETARTHFEAAGSVFGQLGAKRDALERDVCVQWQEFVVDGSMSLQVGMTTATALK
jgi:hypothetical protein